MSAKADAVEHVDTSKLSPQFHVAHHFDKASTQFDAGRMGVWLFLVTEILLFGGLFCAFAIIAHCTSVVTSISSLPWYRSEKVKFEEGGRGRLQMS